MSELVKRQVEEVKEAPERKVERQNIDIDNLIPTGLTLLNCACADNPFGGYGIGKIINTIGDSHSGKTLLALTCFAEMSKDKRFKDYRFIFDDAEVASEFDLPFLLGKEAASRIKMERISSTVESFYGNIIRIIKDGRPFAYLLDSFDALTSIEEQQRAERYAGLRKLPKGQKEGSYKTEKAKMLTEILRGIVTDNSNREFFVNIISQTKDNITSSFVEKTRSGGKALKAFACHEMWLAVLGSKREKGIIVSTDAGLRISKNKITGKKRQISFPILIDYGIDDITTNVEYLVEEGIWKIEKQTITAKDFNIKGVQKTIIKEIECKKLQKELQILVGDVWKQIEESVRPDREPRF